MTACTELEVVEESSVDGLSVELVEVDVGKGDELVLGSSV